MVDWINRSMFLERKTGQEIVDKQTEINNHTYKKVVATTIFSYEGIYQDLPKGNKHRLYDAFIYYQEDADGISEEEAIEEEDIKLKEIPVGEKPKGIVIK